MQRDLANVSRKRDLFSVVVELTRSEACKAAVS
jgi:hypothetical protein